MFRTLKIVDIYQPYPAIRAEGTAGCRAAAACPPGPHCGPGPGGGGGPVSAGGSGAMPRPEGPARCRGATDRQREPCVHQGAQARTARVPWQPAAGTRPGRQRWARQAWIRRPFGFGGDVTTSGAGGIRGPPNGPVVRREHGSGSPGRGKGPGGGVYEHGEPCDHGGSGMVRRCLPAASAQAAARRWPEALPVRVGEPERRQARVAPELLGIDAALLECGVDQRLNDLVRQQVDEHHLEVRARRDGLAKRRGELAHRRQRVDEVELAATLARR